jgi:hypothetical protein
MFHRHLARAGALVALSAAALVGCGDSEPAARPPVEASPQATTPPPSATPPTTAAPGRTIEVVYTGGEVVGGARKETVRLGERVRIRVTSDVAEQVHVHTYDLRADVAPGQAAEVDLIATIPGRHEVELEKASKPLLTLEVR